MKQFVLSLTLLASLGAFAQGGKTASITGSAAVAVAAPAIATAAKFTQEVVDFGTIKQGTPVTADFVFKNVTKSPLVVASASGSCGCTVGTKPEKPVMPGKTDKISATFNAASAGAFEKTVTVMFAGVTTPKVLTIKGTVVAN